MARAGAGGRASERRGMQRDGKLTSPSHLFFPFLQAVQALAPRFGMFAGGWDGEGCADPAAGIWDMFCSCAGRMVFVRRRFEGTSELFEVVAVGDKDMVKDGAETGFSKGSDIFCDNYSTRANGTLIARPHKHLSSPSLTLPSGRSLGLDTLARPNQIAGNRQGPFPFITALVRICYQHDIVQPTSTCTYECP